MTKYVSMAISMFTLFMWAQTLDYWLLVASLAWLVIFMFSEEIASTYGKVRK